MYLSTFHARVPYANSGWIWPIDSEEQNFLISSNHFCYFVIISPSLDLMKLEFPLPYDALKLGRNLRNSIEAIFLGEKYIFRRNNEDFSQNNVVSLFGINMVI